MKKKESGVERERTEVNQQVSSDPFGRGVSNAVREAIDIRCECHQQTSRSQAPLVRTSYPTTVPLKPLVFSVLIQCSPNSLQKLLPMNLGQQKADTVMTLM